MLLDVAAQIVITQNVKISKRKRYIMYCVTKRNASQNDSTQNENVKKHKCHET